MTDPTAFRLDTVDLAWEYGWEVEHPNGMDEFTKDGVTILVQYASDDAITSIRRSRPNRAEESFSDDSPGNPERIRLWLTGRPSLIATSGTGVFQGLKIKYDGTNPWSPQQFLDAVEDPGDRAFLSRILHLVQQASRRPATGAVCHLCFGEYPGGWMSVYPSMRRFPPYKFKIDAGQLMIAGCWKSNFKIADVAGFAELASLLDLDHTGSAPWSRVSGLDPDELWAVGERVSRAINP